MIDFNKKIKNSDKFRQAAIQYIDDGSFCQYPKGSTEYYKFWDEETNRCINGYTADDGDYISGYNYFYLNYCPIVRIVYEDKKDHKGIIKKHKVRIKLFPDFYDYDYYFYQSVDEAEDQGKHLVVLKSRRKGYSYKCASMLDRNYYFFPDSKSYAYVSNKQYLTEDGILNKAWEYMDFIDKETAWGKKRQVSNTLTHRRASMLVTDEFGNKIEMGYKSEIIGVSLKDNPGAVRGKAGKLILFEEAGSFPELGSAWNIARPSVEQDGVAFGLMVMFGTGGDPNSQFATLKDAFYNPAGYNCLCFDNIWDEAPGDSQCGFFVPQYTNLDIRDTDGNRLYMDNDGNTNRSKALQYILSLRKVVLENATNSAAVDRYVAENAITPQESCLDFNGNIFPKKELQQQLSLIRTNKVLQNCKQVGDLIFDTGGQITWLPKKTGDVTRYPLQKDDDPTGSVVIWEHPDKNPPVGLYIIGIDPYDHDQSGTNSLGSALVYKRFQNFNQSYSETIVAEYTGRPQTAEDFYEICRKLALYYNARIMYENERKGLFPYFTAKHSDYLLADQPDIINDIVGNSKVQRRKGCHISGPIKQWGEGMIKDWLNESYSEGKKDLTKILSEPLLEELISYNNTGNFDRVCALIQVMIYREQLHNVVVKNNTEENKKRVLFDGPIFSQGQYDDDQLAASNELPTYTF